MVRGVLVGFAIMVVLALIPIVHVVGIPFGPFIGGYFGISAVGGYTEARAKRSLTFGVLLGLIIFLVAATVATGLIAVTEFPTPLVWGVVAVFTFYTCSMGALGAMYAQLRTKA